jgi:hypothetical protein
VYIIVSGKYNNQPAINLNLSHVSNTRGNIYKLQLIHLHYNLRKHFFSNRIVATWDSIPNNVVSAESTNTFKSRLDKFWAHRDFKFVWNADNTGIGSHSINSSLDV